MNVFDAERHQQRARDFAHVMIVVDDQHFHHAKQSFDVLLHWLHLTTPCMSARGNPQKRFELSSHCRIT
jgi:hypothetical protein